MWQFWIVVVIALIVSVVLIIIIKAIHNRGDYRDGGGIQKGGSNYPSIWNSSNERAGIRGERFANYHLRPLLRSDEYLLANVLLPLKNNHTTELDCVMISRKGIFCIETKYWVGYIRGGDEDEYWTQVYDNLYRKNKKHRNPVKQNTAHCAVLAKLLNNKVKIENIVIFVNLEYRRGISSRYAYTIRQFKNYYRQLNDDVLSTDEIEQLSHELSNYIATKEQLNAHKEDVKNSHLH